MFINLHLIQSVPPSAPNRGQDGGQKSIKFGGSNRIRYSSQAQKRATREWYRQYSGNDRAIMDAQRSRLWHTALAQRLNGKIRNPDIIARLALGMLNTGVKKLIQEVEKGDSNLTFLSVHELEAIGNVVIDHSDKFIEISEMILSCKNNVALCEEQTVPPELKKSDITKILKDLNKIKGNVVGDVALFGRMMAQTKDLSVDGCVQVAHAISVNSFEFRRTSDGPQIGEIDFFSAIDDFSDSSLDTDDSASVGMIGERGISSPVMYRYSNIAAHSCVELMGDIELAKKAVTDFINGFVRSLPKAGVTSYAHGSLPEFILIEASDYQPYMHASAFLNAVNDRVGDQSIAAQAASALINRSESMHRMYDDTPAYSGIVALPEICPGGIPLNSAIDKALSVVFPNNLNT